MIIPSSRVISWDPGVRGGIPNATTIYTTLTSSATAAQINTAITNASAAWVSSGRTVLQVVLLGAGTYSINATIIMKSGVVLRGGGLGVTILQGAASFTGNSLISWTNGFDDFGGTSKDLVNPQKGDTTITTTTAHGWSVGDYVIIDQLKNAAGDPPIDNVGVDGTATWLGRSSGTRCAGQIAKITATPTSTTATISPGLFFSYYNAPQAAKGTGWVESAGIEDLTIDNLTSSRTDSITLFGAINPWMLRIQSTGGYRRHIWNYASLWLSIEHCVFYGGVPVGTDNQSQYGSDRAYGFFMGPWCTAAICTNSVFQKLSLAIAPEGCVAGCVFSYNYFFDMWWKAESGPQYPRRFGFISHGGSPLMNLIEGNWSGGRFRADHNWGTGSFYTVARNRFIQVNRGSPAAQVWTMDWERGQWYHSFVGNIIGGGGVTETRNSYVNGESRPYESSTATIWSIGYNSVVASDSTNYDAGALNTSLRWRNWVSRLSNGSAGSGIEDIPNNVVDTGDTTVPESYYLNARPSWAVQFWPIYDPNAPTSDGPENLPAYAWYNNQTYTDYRPTGLSVTGTTVSSIALSWTTVAPSITGTVIERSTDNVNFTAAGTVVGSGTTYTDTGLAAGATYYYRVRSYNGPTYRTTPASTSANGTTTGQSAPARSRRNPAAIAAW